MIEADSHATRGDSLVVHEVASRLRRRPWLVAGVMLIFTAAFRRGRHSDQ